MTSENTEQPEITLLGCPLCGGPATQYDAMFSEYYGHEHVDYGFVCEKCGLDLIVDSSSEEFPCSCCHDLEAVAIARWNTRFKGQ